MAAPASKTITDLSGKWLTNSSLSDSSEPIMAIQGVSFLVRKIVAVASINTTIKHYDDKPLPPNTSTDSFSHLHIVQSVAGTSMDETRCLDDIYREQSDSTLGKHLAKTSWVTIDEVNQLDEPFLKEGWLIEDGGKFIKSQTKSESKGWAVTEILGFQTINGERRHCINLVATKGDQVAKARIVYDFVSGSKL